MRRKLIHHNILFLVLACLLSLQQIHSARTTEALKIDGNRQQESLLVQGRAATSPRHQHIISAQSHDATQQLRQAGVPYVSGLDSLQTVFDEGAKVYIPRLARTGDSIQVGISATHPTVTTMIAKTLHTYLEEHVTNGRQAVDLPNARKVRALLIRLRFSIPSFSRISIWSRQCTWAT
jgi:hypothetical protein